MARARRRRRSVRRNKSRAPRVRRVSNPSAPRRRVIRTRRRRNPAVSPYMAIGLAVAAGIGAVFVKTKLPALLNIDQATTRWGTVAIGAIGAAALAKKMPAAAGAFGALAGIEATELVMTGQSPTVNPTAGIYLPPALGGVEPPQLGYAPDPWDSVDVGDQAFAGIY